MKLTGEIKFIIGIVIACIVIVGISIKFLSTPDQTVDRSSILTSGTAIKGSRDAKTYLVEFSDFQCPACGAVKPVVDQIVEKYKDKLVFGYRHFPLPQHQFGFKAAEAAEAAGEQGKFWQMYEYLFANQAQLTSEFILTSGKSVGLDEQKFQDALKNNKFKDKVLKDLSDGKSLGVNSTPTFFLNGKKLNLESFNDLQQAIEQEIEK